MRRRSNISMGAGFLIILAALVSYPLLFARYPVTRDFPWANLLLFGAGLFVIAHGLRRARRQPEIYRGRIAGVALLVLGILVTGFFAVGVFYLARQLPASAGAPRVGQRAPDFTLTDTDGHRVGLADLVGQGGSGTDRGNGVLLIFYRGYW